MELITVILVSLFTLVSPVGLVADRLVEGLIRDRLPQAEQLDVRIDNAPSHQLLRGRVEHVRLAARGVYLLPELRIDTLDIETDPIDLSMGQLRQGRIGLDQPVQSAAHLVLKAEDLNHLLQSERVRQQLTDLRFNLPGQAGERQANRYSLANPRLTLLGGDRIRVQVDLQDRVLNETVAAILTTGVAIADGHQWMLLNPEMTVDGEPVPRQLINTLAQGIEARLSLKQLTEVGVVARVLQFELSPEALEVAVFVRVEPDSPLLGN